MTVTLRPCRPPSDQPQSADRLTDRLPVAWLPVLPPQTAAEGKEGQGPAGRGAGAAGAQPQRGQRLQAPPPHQRPRCHRGLSDIRAEDWGKCRIYFCMRLQMEIRQCINPIGHVVWHCFFSPWPLVVTMSLRTTNHILGQTEPTTRPTNLEFHF